MKFVAIILCLITLVSEQPDYPPKDVIILNSIGDFITIMKPMVISTEKLKLPLSGNDIRRLKFAHVDIKNLSSGRIDEITSLEYDKIVTNKFTFSTIAHFISSQSRYYINGRIPINKQHPNSITITYNGLIDTVDYKNPRKFLVDLQHYLILNHCDQSAAKKIANFKYDSHPD